MEKEQSTYYVCPLCQDVNDGKNALAVHLNASHNRFELIDFIVGLAHSQ